MIGRVIDTLGWTRVYGYAHSSHDGTRILFDGRIERVGRYVRALRTYRHSGHGVLRFGLGKPLTRPLSCILAGAKYGMRLRDIIFSEAPASAGIVKPQKPMTPAQSNREAERKAGVQKRIRDQQIDSAQKIKDLRAKLF